MLANSKQYLYKLVHSMAMFLKDVNLFSTHLGENEIHVKWIILNVKKFKIFTLTIRLGGVLFPAFAKVKHSAAQYMMSTMIIFVLMLSAKKCTLKYKCWTKHRLSKKYNTAFYKQTTSVRGLKSCDLLQPVIRPITGFGLWYK